MEKCNLVLGISCVLTLLIVAAFTGTPAWTEEIAVVSDNGVSPSLRVLAGDSLAELGTLAEPRIMTDVAFGDVDGVPGDEIVTLEGDVLLVLTRCPGGGLTLIAAATKQFSQDWVSVAIGDVDGLPSNEIVVVGHGGFLPNTPDPPGTFVHDVEVYSYVERGFWDLPFPWPNDWKLNLDLIGSVPFYQFPYDQWSAVAIGDVTPDAGNEIVVVSDTGVNSSLRVFSFSAGLADVAGAALDIAKNNPHWVDVAIGDIDGLAGNEIVAVSVDDLLDEEQPYGQVNVFSYENTDDQWVYQLRGPTPPNARTKMDVLKNLALIGGRKPFQSLGWSAVAIGDVTPDAGNEIVSVSETPEAQVRVMSFSAGVGGLVEDVAVGTWEPNDKAPWTDVAVGNIDGVSGNEIVAVATDGKVDVFSYQDTNGWQPGPGGWWYGAFLDLVHNGRRVDSTERWSAVAIGNLPEDDLAPPIIIGSGARDITPPDAPISFTATATDACSNVTIEIRNLDCHMINRAGKRVDKTESCVVSANGATVTITDSGGVGNIITYTIVATDDRGNVSTQDVVVNVLNPGKSKK